ncbi:MAG: hypothetical protein WC648_03505 [Candidatus Paceibacterota bacterium]|jgi:hypothetical protein
MDTLVALFGNVAKVKILRLFIFNETTPFLLKEVVERTKSPSSAVKKELFQLVKSDIIKKKEIIKEVQVLRGKKTVVKKIQGSGFIMNSKFPYLNPLKNLLAITSLQTDDTLAKRFTNAGKIKLFIVSGVFIQNWDSRVDLLIVGDELNLGKIETVIKVIESEIGKEIAYSAFETQDFEYRFGIHDRLVRDILDYPHVTLLDRIGISPA